MAPLWSRYHGKKASQSRKKVHSKKELGPWQSAGRRCTSFNEVTEILGESSFIWSRCCRECSPAGLLRLRQSTRPGLCRRAGRWPARGNWPPWGRRRDLPLSGSSCGGREKTRGCCWCYSHHEYESNQCTSFLPDTVHHSVIGLLVSSFFEWLQPCLYHWRRQTWLTIIINSSSRRSSSRRRRSILACNSSSELRFSILSLLSIVSVINVYKIPKVPQSLTPYCDLIPNSTCSRLQKAFLWVLHTKHRPPSPSQGLTATAATHPAKQPDIKDQ